MTKQEGWCNHPDRHEPKLRCGYPLPCPHHTAIIDPPDIISIPLGTADKVVERLNEISKAIYESMAVPKDMLWKNK